MKAYYFADSCIHEFEGAIVINEGFLHGIVHALVYTEKKGDEAWKVFQDSVCVAPRYTGQKTVKSIFYDIAHANGFNLYSPNGKEKLDEIPYRIEMVEIVPNIHAVYSIGYINRDTVWNMYPEGNIKGYTLDAVLSTIRNRLLKESNEEIDINDENFVEKKNCLQAMQAFFGGYHLYSHVTDDLFCQVYKLSLEMEALRYKEDNSIKQHFIPSASTIGYVLKAMYRHGVAIVKP